jgi:ribose transport system permease protein
VPGSAVKAELPAAPPAPPAGSGAARARAGARARGWAGRFGVLLFLVAMIVAFSVALPDRFATAGNFRSMVESQAVLLLLALAATVPLRAGDFDLSIAAMMTATGAMGARILQDGGSLAVVLLLAVAMGVLVGLVNGFFVVKIGVDSFITTLGSLTALTGLTFAIARSEVIFGFDGGVVALARTDVLGLPLAVWYGWLLVLVAWYVYERTPVGRYLLFVGGGRDVARLAGLKVDRIRMGAFVASSTLAALAGIVLIGDLGAFDPSIGPSYLLQPFAAAFLGAATLYVGRFNAFGTLIGLYLLIVGITGLQLLGAETWVSDVFNGVALILAVTVARVIGGRGGQAEART